MRAMILAAGLGTRLRPLTRVRPKTLVPLMGTTVFHFWLSRLADLDFERVVANAFLLPEQLIAAAQDGAVSVARRGPGGASTLGYGWRNP